MIDRDLVKSLLPHLHLCEEYARMAAELAREAEALEWSNALLPNSDTDESWGQLDETSS
jgi:hypothetical protein